jgi:hypothetical protein
MLGRMQSAPKMSLDAAALHVVSLETCGFVCSEAFLATTPDVVVDSTRRTPSQRPAQWPKQLPNISEVFEADRDEDAVRAVCDTGSMMAGGEVDAEPLFAAGVATGATPGAAARKHKGKTWSPGE